MRWPQGALSVLCALALCTCGVSGGRYLLTAPSRMIQGSDYDVTVDILPSEREGPVEVEAKLLSSVYNHSTYRNDLVELLSVTREFTPGTPGKLSLPIGDDLACRSCRLQVRGRGSLVLDKSLYTSVSRSVVVVLAQTDKAIYKPGQIVRYRALAVRPNLQIYNGVFNVVIKDPRGNRVQFRSNVTGTAGVIEGKLAISEQPLFGDWTIRVSLQGLGDMALQKFTVADYELPRFEVTVELSPYGLTSQQELSGTVRAKYTFGQPVTGRVELHVGPNRGPNSCGQLPSTVQISFEIDGEATFSMPREDFVRALGGYLGDSSQVKVTAIVKEEATGVRLNGSSVITYHDNQFNIKFLDNTPSVFKPGLPYTAFLQVSTPDGMPPAGQASRLVNVYTVATYRTTVADQSFYSSSEFTGTYPLPGRNITLPESGILPVDFAIPTNATTICIKATFGREVVSKTIQNAYSPGNTFMQLTLLGRNIKAGTAATFKATGTEPLHAVNYMILSRGSIASTGAVQGQGEPSFTFDLEVTHAMAPTAHILAYYVRGSSEVVADSLAFKVDGLFDNEVAVNFSQARSQPASNLSLSVRADPASSVCVLAVDQSVLLLKSGNDITPDKVGESISKFETGKTPSDSEFALSYSSRSTRDVFTNVGLKILTDLPINAPSIPTYNRRHRGYNRGPSVQYDSMDYDMDMDMDMPMSMSGPRGPSTALTQESGRAAPVLAEVERIRNVFPEAWLWSSGVAGSDGIATFQTTVPDTITSWVASAFATHPTSGLGVAPTPAKMQVFRPFFVSLTYPSSAVRGEQVVVQATVFNYLSEDAQVRVTLKASSQYSYLQVSESGFTIEENGDVYVDVQVAADEQGVVYFPLQTTQIGLATIEVHAQTGNAADGVRRTINVKAEGAAASYNIPIFINNAEATAVTEETLSLPLPPSLVEGSDSTRVKVSGDLMGSSLVNLDSLLDLPLGCGEQSMVRFLPDYYVYQHLRATNQLTQFYQTSIKRRLESGYQRQLTYQRFDKGFSAFGNHDDAGSTWLTSMVLQAFVQAQRVIYIDRQVIRGALTWLVDRQSADGSFKELGNIIDRSMQGTSERTGLTSHVLISLLHSRRIYSTDKLRACERPGPRPPNYHAETCRYLNATRRATTYLESQMAGTTDQLSLSILALALTRANSPVGQQAFSRLQTLASVEGNLAYWADNATSSTDAPTPLPRHSVFLPDWRPPRVQAAPTDIITTSYAILTYIQLGQIQAALPAVTWLARQRNAKGGFASSQDTVMALEALSTVATRMRRPTTQLSLEFTMEGAANSVELSVDPENALTLQIGQLERGASDDVTIEATGAGVTLVEFDVRFNVNEELSTPSFDVSTVLLDDNLDKFNLMVCTKWLWDRKTGMVVQEVSIPTGFEPDLGSMANVAGLKKADRRGGVLEVYFDEITRTSLCYSVMMTRTAKVANTQRNYVRTYDYYSPADQSTVFYVPTALRDATVCDVCDGCCQ